MYATEKQAENAIESTDKAIEGTAETKKDK
jgi:hypothetical protein